MTDREDAAVDSPEPAGVEAMLNRVTTEPERNELPMRDHPVLAICQLTDLAIAWAS